MKSAVSVTLAALVINGGAALAQTSPSTVAATVPIYGHVVRFPAPAGFKHVFQKDNEGRFFILELLPKNEHVMSWTQMFTVTGINGQAGGLPALAQYIQNFSEGYRKACPDTFVMRPLGGSPPAINQPALFFIGCGKVNVPNDKSRSEVVLIGFFASSKGIYSVQWAERSPAQAKPPAFDETKWRPRLDALKTARLCDRVPGEVAPYPSCK